jgi:hypothetical protein
VAVQRGIVTSQELRPSGRKFLVEDASGPPCFRDRWGEWICGHEHDDPVPLEDAYQYEEGWTAQNQL